MPSNLEGAKILAGGRYRPVEVKGSYEVATVVVYLFVLFVFFVVAAGAGGGYYVVKNVINKTPESHVGPTFAPNNRLAEERAARQAAEK